MDLYDLAAVVIVLTGSWGAWVLVQATRYMPSPLAPCPDDCCRDQS